MSEQELRRELWSAVEQHPSTLDSAAEKRMRGLLEEAAARLAEDPSRAAEARQNVSDFLDRAAAESLPQDQHPGADISIVDQPRVTADAVELALRRLCPIFPIC